MKVIKILILMLFVSIGLLVLTGCSCLNTISENNQIVEPKVCEHEWVITSEYDWIFSQYRTISKCSKCCEEIK